MKLRPVAVTAAVCLLLAGCGATRTVTVTRTVTDTVTAQARVVTKTVAAKPPARKRSPANSNSSGSSSGLTVTDYSGNVLRVVAGIVDPAQPDNGFDTPQAGTRLVAVKLTLTGEGPGTVSDDANNDVAIIGSDGQQYTSALSGVAGCTNFNSGVYTISIHQTLIGCVAFDVPEAVRVKAVQFTLAGNTVQFNAR